jgi:pimeloyl-ACP methyl ester carboxylesterase
MPSSYFFLNNSRVHYLNWTAQGAGRPVILIHGLASNARIWELVAPHLLEGGLVPLALDLRGHGLTDGPDGDYGFDTISRDLAAFIKAVDAHRPLLVGHSWGAMVALDFASRFPIGPLAPAGLVLVDGGMTQMDDFPGATWESMRERLTPPRLAGLPLDVFLNRLNTPNPIWQPDDRAIQIILANFEVNEDETINPRLSFEHHMQIVRAMWEFKTYAHYSRLKCPVLMIPSIPNPTAPARDQEYLAFKERGLQRARELIPDLRVERMLNSIHDIPLQHPKALAELILQFEAA